MSDIIQVKKIKNKKHYFTVKDLIVISLVAAVAIGAKVVIGTIIRSFTFADIYCILVCEDL